MSLRERSSRRISDSVLSSFALVIFMVVEMRDIKTFFIYIYKKDYHFISLACGLLFVEVLGGKTSSRSICRYTLFNSVAMGTNRSAVGSMISDICDCAYHISPIYPPGQHRISLDPSPQSNHEARRKKQKSKNRNRKPTSCNPSFIPHKLSSHSLVNLPTFVACNNNDNPN